MQFRLLHNGIVYRTFTSVHELFDFAPETAAWFARNHQASYLEHDHGRGLTWRFERLDYPEPEQA